MATAETLSATDRLLAIAEIKELSIRYALGLDEFDMEKLLEPWAEDAVLDATAFELGKYTGHGEMRTFFRHNFDVMSDQAHMFGNFLMDLEGTDRASGTSYLYEDGHDNDGNQVTVLCLNRDRYVRTDAGWKISERIISGLVAPKLDTYKESL